MVHSARRFNSLTIHILLIGAAGAELVGTEEENTRIRSTFLLRTDARVPGILQEHLRVSPMHPGRDGAGWDGNGASKCSHGAHLGVNALGRMSSRPGNITCSVQHDVEIIYQILL